MGRSHDIDGSINCGFNNYLGLLEKWNLKLIQSLKEGDKQILSCNVPFFLNNRSLDVSLSKDSLMLSENLFSQNRSLKATLSHVHPLSGNSTSFAFGVSQGLLDFDPFRRDHFFDFLAPQNRVNFEASKSFNWSHNLRDSSLALKANLDCYLHDFSAFTRLEANLSDSMYLDSRFRFYDLVQNKLESSVQRIMIRFFLCAEQFFNGSHPRIISNFRNQPIFTRIFQSNQGFFRLRSKQPVHIPRNQKISPRTQNAVFFQMECKAAFTRNWVFKRGAAIETVCLGSINRKCGELGRKVRKIEDV